MPVVTRPVLLALMVLLGAPPALAKDIGPLVSEKVRRADGGLDVSLRNNARGPVTVDVDLTLVNATANPWMKTGVIQGGQTRVVASISPKGNARWRYKWKYNFQYGDMNGRPADVVYRIPYEAGTTQKLGQGYFGKFSHQKAHALDFRMPEGTAIVAARDGVVMATEAGFTEGGVSAYFKSRANHIRIAHDDGSVASYLHLQPNGVLVSPGQRVAAGDVIGRSGNTGYSSRPHLHFEVRVPDSGVKSHSIATRFRTRQAPRGILLQAETPYEAF